MPSTPVFLLGFAYNPDSALPGVVTELKTLTNLLISVTDARTIPLWQPTSKELQQYLADTRNELRVFHYSGHAGSAHLELNAEQGAMHLANADGFAGLLQQAPNLKLVFLNGCSTEGQVKQLLAAGVPAVIATTQPLSDTYGTAFARMFYKAFTNAKSKQTLERAFQYALDSFTMDHGEGRDLLDERVRGNYVDDDPRLQTPVYELHVHPNKQSVANEVFTTWCSLAETVDYEAIKASIRQLVGQARLEEALAKLLPHAPHALGVKTQLAAANHQRLLGVIDYREFGLIQANVTQAILEFTGGLGS